MCTNIKNHSSLPTLHHWNVEPQAPCRGPQGRRNSWNVWCRYRLSCVWRCGDSWNSSTPPWQILPFVNYLDDEAPGRVEQLSMEVQGFSSPTTGNSNDVSGYWNILRTCSAHRLCPLWSEESIEPSCSLLTWRWKRRWRALDDVRSGSGTARLLLSQSGEFS